MTIKVFTIKENIPSKTFGFEKSQLARQSILKSLNIEHKMIINDIFDITPNFVETLEDLGFDNFHHVIFELSNIAREKPCIQDLLFKDTPNIKKIKYTKEGFVGIVEYNNGVIECYTSNKLYTFDTTTQLFTLYNKNQEIILQGDLSENYHKYFIIKENKTLSQWQLVIEYLAENSSNQDKFIIDMLNKYPAQLRKFFQNTNRELIAFTHYNITDPIMKFVLQDWCKNIVASPVLEYRLPNRVTFLPPIYVENFTQKKYNKITDWCIVGNMSFIKRLNWVINAFKNNPEIKLTIYGDIPADIKNQFYKNIHFAGFVKNIPYGKHQGYISCSKSECFANSAVEASANGLVCLLSNVDLAHKYYHSICENTKVFDNYIELEECLKKFQHIGIYNSSTFSQLYTKQNVVNLYKKQLNLQHF